MALSDIQHIVVLMLENRSFDHALGYLTRAGRTDVDGLTGAEKNEHNGLDFLVHVLTDPALAKGPHHGFDDVAQQISGGMGGFVRNYSTLVPQSGWGDVMGHYDADILPVFDFLAENYLVCDRWFSSMPGPTWPNRHFALCGHSGGHVSNLHILDTQTVFEALASNVSWRYYSHDIAFLRSIQGHLTNVTNIKKIRNFFDATRNGTLPAVSWIDPNFTLLPFTTTAALSNDDHPPADVRRGQRLVADVYNALVRGANDLFSRTLLIVTYDEHGGFYDHVSPGSVIPPDTTDARFSTYGVRVPTLVISPWVAKKSVSSTIYDHTSIIRTVLQRFGQTSSAHLTARDKSAADLSSVFGGSVRTDRPEAPDVDVRQNTTRVGFAPFVKNNLQVSDPMLRGIAHPQSALLQATDFQEEMIFLKQTALAAGVPPEAL